jgi:predicted phosphodiesterase
VNLLALYDIHGNVDALEAVLEDPRAADPDVVIIGGDAVPGPFASETLAYLDALRVPVRWIRGNGEREVAEAVAAVAVADEDILRFVNAGSVGQPYEGDGAARWLWLADGVPELHRTEYDSVGAGRRILATSWPDQESVEGALIMPVEPRVVTQAFEEIARTQRPAPDRFGRAT